MAANMMDGPAPSSEFTFASGMGEELKRLLEAERLRGGRGAGDLLFGEALSPDVMIEGVGSRIVGVRPAEVLDRAGGRGDGLITERFEVRSLLLVRPPRPTRDGLGEGSFPLELLAVSSSSWSSRSSSASSNSGSLM